ncbi:hypothetical protein TetV_493 [Tetraselmis virus 1]|uniref:Uncharacterized protein n=1 Tax=Tetraselmis virus 1 TaxID=2060617 RepID=A0A2P0VNT4_9VIRU|nr:hypothetical protein QJ968_gp561 [Tetraselmis virus 1]AUF82575.1 hypothetical protein TetV_493 [Tetraselmis virus 1]
MIKYIILLSFATIAQALVCTNDCLERKENGRDTFVACPQFCDQKYYDHDGACAYVPTDCSDRASDSLGCFPKTCKCKSGYFYQDESGLCVIRDTNKVKTFRQITHDSDSTDSECKRFDTYICTRDIGICGHPSICMCQDSDKTYDKRTGTCY